MSPRRVLLSVAAALLVITTGAALAFANARPAARSAIGRNLVNIPNPQIDLANAKLAAGRRHVAAARWPRIVTVAAGQDLAAIARQQYGHSHSAAWTVIYWANRSRIRWASILLTGQRLTIPRLPAELPAAPRLLAPPPPVQPAPQPVTPAPAAAAPAPAPATPAPVAASGSYRQIVASLLPAGEAACLDSIINVESGGNVYASIPSGAYGIPQALPGSKMASAGADWATNPVTQIRWMIGYVNAQYGGACAAWAHWQAAGSY